MFYIVQKMLSVMRDIVAGIVKKWRHTSILLTVHTGRKSTGSLTETCLGLNSGTLGMAVGRACSTRDRKVINQL